jgi:DNA-binding Lrp family transcriptional regulator
MAKLDYHPAIILISLSKYTKQDYQKFITYCKLKEQINYFIKQIGKYDIDLSVNVKNINDFYKLMDEIREEFPFIKKITTLIKK